MDDPRMMGKMFDRAVPQARQESSAPVFSLPLNLIALIISYVRCPLLQQVASR